MLRDRDILQEMPVLDGRQEWEEWFENLSPAERQELKGIADLLPRCGPMEGPQRAAFNSTAKVVGYGGAAGGGKTGLIALLALLEQTRSLVVRYDGKQLRGFVDDVIQFYGSTTGLNRQAGAFYFNDRPHHMLEWGGIGEPGTELVWQGRAHDFIAADEVTQLALKKLIWLMTWLRTVERNQRCRALFTFNPPGAEDDDGGGTIPSGTWVLDYFAPWINERHPNPAEPGEIRYFLTNKEGENQEVDSPDPVEIKLKDKIFIQEPQSRTFYPATVQDNVHLRGTDYEQTLLQHPEPLRSQMLLGDFRSGIVDHPSQVIPSKWVDEAMDRWTPQGQRDHMMSALGVDVARGGRAFTVLAPRHKFWWGKLQRHRGLETPDGDTTAGLCVQSVKNAAWICIDANGIGSSPYDSLKRANTRVHGIKGQQRKGLKRLPGDKPYNLRTWLYFCLRHILDPKFGFLPALPPDNRLRSDLIAPKYSIVNGGFALMESKEEIRARLKRSTDDGDAVTLACYNIFTESETERLNAAPPVKRMGELPDAWNPDLYADNQWMNL